eukprot:8237931-Ditylum_brightwellii.AAC.2
MNTLELAAYVAQLALQDAACPHLIHISNGFNNIAAISYTHKGSSCTSSANADLLCQHYVISSTCFLPDIYNATADNASCLTHLSHTALLHHFDIHYSQPHSWCHICLHTELKLFTYTALCKTSIDHNLHTVCDPIPFIQLFAFLVYHDFLAANNATARKCQVKQYLCSVVQIITGMGACNPYIDRLGKINVRLQQQLAFCTKGDPALVQVMPVQLGLLQYIWTITDHNCPKQQ